MAESPPTVAAAETPTLEGGGAYEVIRNRLSQHSQRLGQKLQTLNDRRVAAFGSTQMAVVGRTRIRTDNNCVPRDIIDIGEHLLFGYNVFVGLRPEIAVGDVFSLHKMEEGAEGIEFTPLPLEHTFLADPRFVADFQELYRYYKEARLSLLRNVDGKKLAVFQIGRTLQDAKVFRWAARPDGGVQYIDNRGERDNVYPRQHDFAWSATGREQHVAGRHPHVSILNEVFVETVGGSLTVKVENNTEDGLGIYNEPVDDPNQSLADAQIAYAKLGILILLKIRPYREERWRYLVFNTRTQAVTRIDAIGQACLQLPEDHGLIFPGGYYLHSGETKRFEGEGLERMQFKRMLRSPNGEDVLYVFLDAELGKMVLFSYNLIRKEVQNPIVCHGYSIFRDGRLVVFRADDDKPARVHPMQIWQTPYYSPEYAAQIPIKDAYLAKLGNADLVRGISDAYSIKRMLDEPRPTLGMYEGLIATVTRALDAYHWLGHAEVGDLAALLKEIQATAELILDEFEKVQALQRQAGQAVQEAEARQQALFASLKKQSQWRELGEYVAHLSALRQQRGQVITLKELRYVDLAALARLEQAAVEAFAALGRASVEFLLGSDALRPYHAELDTQLAKIAQIGKTPEAAPVQEALEQAGSGLDLLGEVLNELPIADPQARTRILEDLSEVYAKLNRARAELGLRRKQLLSGEAVAEFAAQFKLFSQSVAGALNLADTPDKADEQLSRLMVQLEELESRFSEFDEFLGQIAAKREEVYADFEARKQSLVEERQRRALHLSDAAARILQGIGRRVAALDSSDAQNAFFAADPMVQKVRELVDKLSALGDSVKAGDIEGRLKALRDQSLRELRDKQEIFSEGGAVIKLGEYAFGVNTQALDLTLIPRESDGAKHLAAHLTGTDFFQTFSDPQLEAAREYWEQSYVSESAQVYRGEYLAAELLFAAEADPAYARALEQAALGEGGLLAQVRRYAAERYAEGYARGVHDVDAALILDKLLALYHSAGLLRYGPDCRALARCFWLFYGEREHCRRWEASAKSLRELRAAFGGGESARAGLRREIAQAVSAFQAQIGPPLAAIDAQAAADYLLEELQAESLAFTLSGPAAQLAAGFQQDLEGRGKRRAFEDDLAALQGHLAAQLALALAWLQGYADTLSGERAALLESAAHLLTAARVNHRVNSAVTRAEIGGLLGQHPRIRERALVLQLDEFLARLRRHRALAVPGFHAYRALRQDIVERERRALRLEELKAKPLTTFVRNRLINEVYMPLVGANFAKQMGTVGEGKRTDLMGLLLLISPPGYGKTTLMEYLAQRLGLVFVKINCPTLGHGVTSVDPGEAPNATARQELEKLNLALEMGNNVMLYLDDIQHASAELLQKFISLADAQRRIEGVWRGRTRTYDFRGKRFCVVMAGNPYTESGEVFKIPDMLANRADIYNLGDVLGGKQDLFALSYLENALTSNPVLAPLANRDQADVYRLVRLAQGEDVPGGEFSHAYAAGELSEILSVLRKLFRVRDVLLKVNRQYIASAAQADRYRTEPPFKLQGSYRNMNKLAEKIVAVMNEQELENLIEDHYQGEAQTLTAGAEENLLKLAELRERMTPEQAARWADVKRTFRRLQSQGDSDADPATRLVNQLGGLGERLDTLQNTLERAAQGQRADFAEHLGQINRHLAALPKLLGARKPDAALAGQAEKIAAHLQALPDLARALGQFQPSVQVVNQLPAGLEDAVRQMVEMIDGTLLPVVRQFERKSRLDLVIWERLRDVSETLKEVSPEAFAKARARHWDMPKADAE